VNADVIDIVEYLESRTVEGLIKESLSDTMVQESIVDLNLKQLGEYKDSNNIDISSVSGPYSVLTQSLKGVSPDQITFRDTGAYWRTFTVEPVSGGYIIDSDPIKDGKRITKWYEDVEGLTPVNETVANGIIEDKIWKTAEEKI